MSYLYENTIQKKTRIVHDKPPILRTISGVKTGRGPKSGTDPDFVDPYFGSQTLRTIGVTFWREGTSPESTVNMMLCVGDCDPLDHGAVFTYKSERDLLDAWRDR